MTKVSLRPYIPADARRCADIFRAAIDELAADDYSAEQREAWAARADDEAEFGKHLASMLTLIGLVEGEEAGFASLKGADVLHMLFVAPEFARAGVATALIDALVKLAAARGAQTVTAEASETARPLFEKLGFVAQKRNVVNIDGEWLANTTMTRALGPQGPKPQMQ